MRNIFLILCAILCILSCSKDDSGEENGVDTSGNTKTTGTSANEFLSEDEFSEMYLEIVYVEGFKPTETAINNFVSFLESRLNKPGGIVIEQRAIASPGISAYSVSDVIDIEKEHREKYNSEGQITVFGFFADGEYAENTENSSVLGIAYRNTSFAVFEETIRDFSNDAFAPALSVLETTVINHEFGHLLGLVNAGTTPQSSHQDTEHGKHCTEEDCLMYWTAETGEGLLSMLTGGTVPSLDSQCIADLQANGGK